MFRKQKIFNSKKEVVWQESLYKNIPELIAIKEDTDKKIIKDLELLKAFLKSTEDLPDYLKENWVKQHFNINAETLIKEADIVIAQLNNANSATIKNMVLEILENSCLKCENVIAKNCSDRLVDVLLSTPIELIALDDYPNGFSNDDNIIQLGLAAQESSKEWTNIVKFDWIFWQTIFQKYDDRDDLKSLRKKLLFRIEKLQKNQVDSIVIEWIETKAHWDFVKKLDEKLDIPVLWQGFYLGKPK